MAITSGIPKNEEDKVKLTPETGEVLPAPLIGNVTPYSAPEEKYSFFEAFTDYAVSVYKYDSGEHEIYVIDRNEDDVELLLTEDFIAYASRQSVKLAMYYGVMGELYRRNGKEDDYMYIWGYFSKALEHLDSYYDSKEPLSLKEMSDMNEIYVLIMAWCVENEFQAPKTEMIERKLMYLFRILHLTEICYRNKASYVTQKWYEFAVPQFENALDKYSRFVSAEFHVNENAKAILINDSIRADIRYLRSELQEIKAAAAEENDETVKDRMEQIVQDLERIEFRFSDFLNEMLEKNNIAEIVSVSTEEIIRNTAENNNMGIGVVFYDDDERLINAAKKSYAKNCDEDIIAIIDRSLLKTAKKGFAFTATKFYASYIKEPISYNEIWHVSSVSEGKKVKVSVKTEEGKTKNIEFPKDDCSFAILRAVNHYNA